MNKDQIEQTGFVVLLAGLIVSAVGLVVGWIGAIEWVLENGGFIQGIAVIIMSGVLLIIVGLAVMKASLWRS